MKIELFSCSSFRGLLGLAGRGFVYAVMAGGIASGMLWGAVHYGPDFFAEVGPVEILQTVFALIPAVIMLLAARKDAQCAPCAVMVAGFLLCLAIRESDYFLDELVARHTWKVLVLVVLAVIATYFVRNTRAVVASVADFMRQPAFGVFMSGLLILVVFSRLFGQGDFWKELIEGPYYRVIKTIVEEGVELMGYFLLLISSVEYRYAARMQLCRSE